MLWTLGICNNVHVSLFAFAARNPQSYLSSSPLARIYGCILCANITSSYVILYLFSFTLIS